ncbi:MAG: phosphate ABC transporter substrate-binding protein [Holophagales bacterium]|nr:phosphate ABC transporter substrate-binding protein [Holophagales bacterium]
MSRSGFSRVLLAVLALGSFGVGGCGGGKAPTKVVVTGSSTVAPLISEIAGRFETDNPGVRIDVQTGGSSRGLADVRQGLAQIGMVSRSPKPGEGDVTWHPIARDGLAMIVHAENPARSITEEQVRAIYRGEVETWVEVRRTETESKTITDRITVVSKAEGRSTLEVFLDHFDLEPPEIAADVIIGDNQQGIKTVAGNPQAIAYVSIGAAEFEARRGGPIRLLELGGVAASTEAVRGGRYPVARTLHLVTAGEPEGWVRAFLEYCRSSAAADLVEGQFFVPLAG